MCSYCREKKIGFTDSRFNKEYNETWEGQRKVYYLYTLPGIMSVEGLKYLLGKGFKFLQSIHDQLNPAIMN